MKVQVNKEALSGALARVKPAVAKERALPVLSHVLLRCRADGMDLTGTDTEIELCTPVEADVEEPGEIAVPFAMLSKMVNRLPSQGVLALAHGTTAAREEVREPVMEAVLDDDGHEVMDEFGEPKMRDTGEDRPTGEYRETGDLLPDTMVRGECGAVRFSLPVLPADDFPVIFEEGAFPDAALVPAHELRRLLAVSSYAMAYQDVRYYLNGLLVEVRPDSVGAVATDGHRLAIARLPGCTGAVEDRNLIIPRLAVLALSQALARAGGDVLFRYGPAAVSVSCGGVRLSSKLIDGRFPDYPRTVPDVAACGEPLVIDRESLARTLSRVAVMASESYQTLRFALGPEGMEVSGKNADQATAGELRAQAWDRDPMEIGFNASYLADTLAHVPGERIELYLTAADCSALVRGAGGASVEHVVMPMRL